MMKSMMKVLLVGAVAVMVIAVSAAPSEAAKKGHHAKAPAKGTYFGQVCSTGGKVMVWGADMKWSPAVFTPVCASPFCPPAC